MLHFLSRQTDPPGRKVNHYPLYVLLIVLIGFFEGPLGQPYS